MTNTGWKESLGGTKDASIRVDLAKESVLSRSLLRDRRGFKNPLFRAYSETLNIPLPNHSRKEEKEEDGKEGMEKGKDEVQGHGMNGSTGVEEEASFFSVEEEEEEVKHLSVANEEAKEEDDGDARSNLTGSIGDMEADENSGKEEEDDRSNGDGDYILDGRECLEHIGASNPRQVHTLSLRSAYESYSVGGEPIFTTSVPVTKKNLVQLHKQKHHHGLHGEEPFIFLFHFLSHEVCTCRRSLSSRGHSMLRLYLLLKRQSHGRRRVGTANAHRPRRREPMYVTYHPSFLPASQSPLHFLLRSRADRFRRPTQQCAV